MDQKKKKRDIFRSEAGPSEQLGAIMQEKANKSLKEFPRIEVKDEMS